MREGAAILLSDMLEAAGEEVIDREERLQAFDRLQLPASATLSRASTIRVGQTVGASLVVSTQTRTAEVPKVIDSLRDELARMTRDPVTESELTLAKSYLIGSFPFRLDTSSKVADFLVAIEAQALGLDYADRYRAAVARVSAADVQRVAAKFFVPDGFSRVVVGKLP